MEYVCHIRDACSVQHGQRKMIKLKSVLSETSSCSGVIVKKLLLGGLLKLLL